MNIIEIFIANNYKKIPPWLRNGTWIVFVLLFVYLTLLPKFVSGTVSMIIGPNQYLSMGKAEIGYLKDSHYLSTISADKGQWSLPLVDRLLNNRELRIYAPGQSGPGRSYSNIEISKWHIALKRPVDVIYNERAGLFYTRQPDIPDALEALTVAFDLNFNLLSPAYAAGRASIKQLDKPKILQQLEQLKQAPSLKQKTLIKAGLEQQINLTINDGILLHDKFDENLVYEAIATSYQLKNAKQQTSPVYLYYGKLGVDDTWTKRYFRSVSANQVPTKGEIISATAKVNKREGYIYYSFFGRWKHTASTGVALPGEKFLVAETKLIAEHLWVKAYPLD
jgi:hypothetical protein